MITQSLLEINMYRTAGKHDCNLHIIWSYLYALHFSKQEHYKVLLRYTRHLGHINWHNYWRKFTKSHILPMRPWQGVFMWRQFSQRLFALSNSAAASDEVEAPGGISIEWPCFFAKLNAREKLCGAILEASCRESWHRLRLWPMHILDDGCALLSKCLGGSVLKFGRFFFLVNGQHGDNGTGTHSA